jgi:hypothetical protein
MEIRRITVQGQPEQKVRKTTSQQNKLDMVAHTCDPSYFRSIVRKIAL